MEEERAVKCMNKDLFNCLHFYDFPQELWKSIRTNNILAWIIPQELMEIGITI